MTIDIVTSWPRNKIILVRTRSINSVFFRSFLTKAFSRRHNTSVDHERPLRNAGTLTLDLSPVVRYPHYKVSYTFLNPTILLDNLSSICSTIIRWCKSRIIWNVDGKTRYMIRMRSIEILISISNKYTIFDKKCISIYILIYFSFEV